MRWVDKRLYLGGIRVAEIHFNGIDGRKTGLYTVAQILLPGIKMSIRKFENDDLAKQALEMIVNNWVTLSQLKFK